MARAIEAMGMTVCPAAPAQDAVSADKDPGR